MCTTAMTVVLFWATYSVPNLWPARAPEAGMRAWVATFAQEAPEVAPAEPLMGHKGPCGGGVANQGQRGVAGWVGSLFVLPVQVCTARSTHTAGKCWSPQGSAHLRTDVCADSCVCAIPVCCLQGSGRGNRHLNTLRHRIRKHPVPELACMCKSFPGTHADSMHGHMQGAV